MGAQRVRAMFWTIYSVLNWYVGYTLGPTWTPKGGKVIAQNHLNTAKKRPLFYYVG